MGLSGMLFRLVMLVVLLGATTTTALGEAQAKPGCPSRCGDVDIPYPFGTTPDCFLSKDFLITCNHSDNPPKAYLRKSNIPVVDITLDGRLNVMHFIARDCYDNTGNPSQSNSSKLTLSKFNVSNSENKFIVIGCDSYAYIRGYIRQERYRSGCMSLCDSLEYVTNGSCTGSGCCQIEIPRGLTDIKIGAYSFNNHTNVSSFNPCTFAFVIDKSQFNFSTDYLVGTAMRGMFPMVLDWEITTNGTCEEASICGINASCDNTKNDTPSGYLCKCNKGYIGNPYLQDGCKDVNECEDPSLHNCKGICINTEGNYTCRCRKGFHGDGRKDRMGCIRNENLVIIVALGVGISFVVTIVIIPWLHFLWKRRKHMKLKEKFFEQNGGSLLEQELTKLRGGSSEKAKIFTEEQIKKVTNNYTNVIARGGSGVVYKGFLPNKTPVAVKKSNIVDQTKIDEFINELIVVSQINRRNVVRLLGCCLETEVPLLVYEFVSNGTLFEHIHNKEKAPTLSWGIRLTIAAETAGVLAYLHHEINVPIIHGDVKSANILLDEKYTAKVSDFGASKLVPIDEIQQFTLVQGTPGYLDPECLQTCKLTEKSDVYSFGVVLVELLTGKKALLSDRCKEKRSLAMHFLSSLKENRFLEIVDNHIVNDGNEQQLKEVAKLATRCLSVKGEERPTMKEVALELVGLSMMHNHYLRDNSQETEDLLCETSTYFDGGNGIDSHTTRTDGYHYTIKQLEPMESDDGR